MKEEVGEEGGWWGKEYGTGRQGGGITSKSGCVSVLRYCRIIASSASTKLSARVAFMNSYGREPYTASLQAP